jgi:hypothetical protein
MQNTSIKDSVRDTARTMFPGQRTFTELEADTFTYWWYSSVALGQHTPARAPPVGDALYDLGQLRFEYHSKRLGQRAYELCVRLINAY